MADQNDFATAVGALIKGRSPVGHTHSWGQITAKPTTFAPAAHTHPTTDVTGLAAALGAVHEAPELGTVDLDTVVVPNDYSQSYGAEATLARHYPPGALLAGKLRVTANPSRSMVTQQYITYTRDDVRWHIRNYFSTWGSWIEVNLGTRKTVGQVIDARPWMVAPHSWLTATKLAVSGPSVTLTISARAEVATAIPGGAVIGNIPADYRPIVEVFSLGQAVGGEGMRFSTNGDIVSPAINAGSYFKVSGTWTR